MVKGRRLARVLPPSLLVLCTVEKLDIVGVSMIPFVQSHSEDHAAEVGQDVAVVQALPARALAQPDHLHAQADRDADGKSLTAFIAEERRCRPAIR